MDLEQMAAEIRSEATSCLEKSGGTRWRYSEEFRAKVVAFTRERVAAGAKVSEVAGELGLNGWTVAKWWWKREKSTAPSSAPSPFHSVKLVAMKAETKSPTVMGPRGLRIEGLSLSDIAELVRALA